MPRSHFEQAATVTLTAEDGRQMEASALLERDPHFLRWNRMWLLGTRDQMLGAMRFNRSGLVEWRLHARPDWPGAESMPEEGGSGLIRSVGVASGVAIADDSVQKFAEVELFDVVQSLDGPWSEEPRFEYWFLQRPRDWFVAPRRPPVRSSTERGDWRKVRPLGLRFRLKTVDYVRRDERVSNEAEQLSLPAVEIAPMADAGEDFAERADRLWMCLRVLLTFRFRQPITTVAEMCDTPSGYRHHWHSVALEPRGATTGLREPPFYGRIETYLAKGATTLAGMESELERLHAACYGYAASANAEILESALTDCVEGLEALVTAFEETRGLDREIVSKTTWRKVSKALRRTMDALEMEPAVRKAIKTSLAMPAMLTLQQRIERMARRYSKRWSRAERNLLRGLAQTIKARNAIVHGRLGDNPNRLHIEVLRARVFFELLFLGFIGCHRLDRSGWPVLTISSYDDDATTVALAS